MDNEYLTLVDSYINDSKISTNEQTCLILGVIHACQNNYELLEIQNIIKASTIQNKDRILDTINMFIKNYISK